MLCYVAAEVLNIHFLLLLKELSWMLWMWMWRGDGGVGEFCVLEFYLNVLVEVYFKGFWFDGGMIIHSNQKK